MRRVRNPGAALQFDHLRAGAHEPCGVLQGLCLGGIAHEGHVPNQESPTIAALHATDVIDHIFHGHRQSAVVPLQDHAKRIADQNDIYAGLTQKLAKTGVIGGQAGELLLPLLHFLQRAEGDWGAACRGADSGLCAHRESGPCVVLTGDWGVD